MIIALPEENGNVNQHFGKSTNFGILEISEGEMKNKQVISVLGLQHQHAGLATLLLEHKVDTVIVGGIGSKAIEALEQAGLHVVSGASGQIEQVVAMYINGQLTSSRTTCNCNH